MTLDEIRQRVVRLGLHTKGSGERILSPRGGDLNWLIDLRRVFMDRATLEAIAEAFWERFKDREPFQLAGMETAAIPLLTALLLSAPKDRGCVNSFIIRKERKTYGLGNAIEGQLTHEPIVLIDDIINSGASAEKARAVVEAAGGSVQQLFAVIDYHSSKGTRWREEHAIGVHSLFALADFGLESSKGKSHPRQRYRALWKRAIPGGNPFYVVPKSGPLYADGKVFRGCDAAIMHCFDADTGAVVWQYETKGTAQRKGIWSTPALSEGQLYFSAYNGVVYCLDAESGKEIWTRSYCEWVGSSPVVVPKHGLVYVGLEYERPWALGGIAALNLRDGLKAWEYPVKKYQHGSPTYWEDGDLIIWGTADHVMMGLDAKTGKVRWAFPSRRSVKYPPAVDPKRKLVAFASFDRSIYILDAATGVKRGEWQTGEICYTTPLFFQNRLFCGSGDRHLYVIDLDTMSLIAKLDMKSRIYASPCVIGERVVFGTTGGQVIELNPQTLEIEGQLQLPDSITNAVATSADGKHMYVSTYMNHMYAYERL